MDRPPRSSSPPVLRAAEPLLRWIWVSTSGNRAHWTSVPTHSSHVRATSAPINGHVPVLLTDEKDEVRVHYVCQTCDRLTAPYGPAAHAHECPGRWLSGAACPRGYVCAPCGYWCSDLTGLFSHLETAGHARTAAHAPAHDYRSYLCPGCRFQYYASGRFLEGHTTVGGYANDCECPLWRITRLGHGGHGHNDGHGDTCCDDRGDHMPRPGVIGGTGGNKAPWSEVLHHVTRSFEDFRGDPARPVNHGCLSCGRVGPFPWNGRGQVRNDVHCQACRDRDSRYFCVACRFVFTGGEELYLQHRHSNEHLMMQHRHGLWEQRSRGE